MLYHDTVDLISETLSANNIGDMIATETRRTVFVEVHSFNTKRKTEVSSAGLKNEIKFILSDIAEYHGEAVLEYAGKRYNIVSASAKDDHAVELIAKVF